ncbi:hypothetical protein F4782DRAFT_502180, partial [Xylaria castorea]
MSISNFICHSFSLYFLHLLWLLAFRRLVVLCFSVLAFGVWVILHFQALVVAFWRSALVIWAFTGVRRSWFLAFTGVGFLGI